MIDTATTASISPPMSISTPFRAITRRRAWAGAIFGIALVLRFAILGLTFRGNAAVEYYDDAQIALNVINGHGFSINYDYRNFLFYKAVLNTASLQDPVTEGTRPTAVKQPAYALLLTVLFYLFGAKNFLVVFVLHAVISSLTVALLYLCLSKTAPSAALVAALGGAVYPAFAGHAVTVPESTTFLLLMIVAVLFCMVNVSQRPSWSSWGIAGLTAGLTILTEPITIPFVAMTLAYAAYLGRSAVQPRLAGLALAGAVVLLILAPWLVRNYIVFDRFPVLKTGAMGHVFVWGLKFSGKGSWIPDERIVALEKSGRALNEVEEEAAIQRDVLAGLSSHWGEYVAEYIPRNLLNLWWDVQSYRNDYSPRYTLGRRLPFVLLLCLALPRLIRTLTGLVQQSRATLTDRPVEIAALVLMSSYSAVYAIFGAFHSRYRLPIELALFIFAGATAAPWANRLWHRFAPASSIGRCADGELAAAPAQLAVAAPDATSAVSRSN
jgi:Dolichyl-phosphate-mannose-protein mannosyltransferase